MADIFGWDNSVGKSTASTVKEFGVQIVDDLTALVADVNTAKDNGQWECVEEEAFTEIFESWQQAADAIFGAVDGISKLIEGTDTAVDEFRAAIREALG